MNRRHSDASKQAQVEFTNAMRDYSIWLHMLTESELLYGGLDTLEAMVRTLQAAQQSLILSAALPAIEVAQERGTWQTKDLPLFVSALEVVGKEYPLLNPAVAQSALAKVMQ